MHNTNMPKPTAIWANHTEIIKPLQQRLSQYTKNTLLCYVAGACNVGDFRQRSQNL